MKWHQQQTLEEPTLQADTHIRQSWRETEWDRQTQLSVTARPSDMKSADIHVQICAITEWSSFETNERTQNYVESICKCVTSIRVRGLFIIQFSEHRQLQHERSAIYNLAGYGRVVQHLQLVVSLSVGGVVQHVRVRIVEFGTYQFKTAKSDWRGKTQNKQLSERLNLALSQAPCTHSLQSDSFSSDYYTAECVWCCHQKTTSALLIVLTMCSYTLDKS